MAQRAAIGVEVPCQRKPGTNAELLLLWKAEAVFTSSERAGRLRAPRSLGRALQDLLHQCQERLRARLRTLPPHRQWLADVLVTNHRTWEKGVRRRYLTAHHLRVPASEQFCCFGLPISAWNQLHRQLAGPLEKTPEQERIALVLHIPITPCMRLHDPVAAYLHAPSRYIIGPWWQVQSDRVHREVRAGKLMVVVE